MRHRTLPALLFTTMLLTTAHAETPATPPAPQFDEAKLSGVAGKMRELVDKNEISGAVTLVATRGKIVHLEAVGKADVAGDAPMRPDSIFWIASMTKPITATAVLMLQDEGKLSVDDPVAKYLPELADLKTPSGKPANLTLRHLLTHTSGLGEATGEETRTARTLGDLIPAYAKKPMQFEPGAKWSYCQSGINSLGRIIEVASGQSYPDFLQKRLFDPLGMKDATFYPTKEQLPRVARAYKTVGGKLEEAKIFILEGRDPAARDRVPLANGGLFCTASDYARFLQMILSDGTLDGKTYLKPESVKLMTTIQTGDLHTGFTEGNGWGLGWCVVRHPQGVTEMLSPGTHGHGGAYGTQGWVDSAKGVVYVMMVQRANFPNGDDSVARKAFQEAAAGALK